MFCLSLLAVKKSCEVGFRGGVPGGSVCIYISTRSPVFWEFMVVIGQDRVSWFWKRDLTFWEGRVGFGIVIVVQVFVIFNVNIVHQIAEYAGIR